MQTLEITDEQYAFIQRLREGISADVVGKYGFVREQDAVQFLIDNLDEDVEVDAAVDFSATDDVAASVSAAIDGGADPHELEAISYDETADTGVADDDGESVDETDSADEDDEATTDEPDTDDASTEDDTDDGAADDDDMLDEMMSLLETYDDKWTESSSADYRYTVTLPDGSTEDVQTKDDVRALLFKNYR